MLRDSLIQDLLHCALKERTVHELGNVTEGLRFTSALQLNGDSNSTQVH